MVTAILIFSAIAYHISRIKEERLYNYAYHQNTLISIHSILDIRERTLNQNLEDNAAWDDMVAFVKTGDTVWASENLGTSRKTLKLDIIKIYNVEFKPFWCVMDTGIKPDILKDLTQTRLQGIFQSGKTCHFFQLTNSGLLEIYGSIIVPSLDIARKTAARGYLFFGKLWDKESIDDLEKSSNSSVKLINPDFNGSVGQTGSTDENSREISVYLKDYSGKDIARVDFMSNSFFKADTRLFYLFSLIPFILALIILVIFYSLIHKWITIPVNKIIQSLDLQEPSGLARITPKDQEFYAIASLVGESFEIRKNLESEISERKKAEDRISKFADELQEINISKDKFFSILAHDLKSPFHYLLGYSDLLKNEFETMNDEDRKKFISIIHSNSQRLYNLLENLLEWSRIQTGRIDFEMEVFDLGREVKQLCETVKASAIHKNIRLENKFSDQALVKADRNMIRSSFHNLLTNAIKYTPEGGSVSVEFNIEESNFEVSVNDSGVGMSPEVVAKLFRIDSSISKPGTNKEPGTGLGLILTKEFIEKNGGSLFVESVPDKGSRFRITLPVYKA